MKNVKPKLWHHYRDTPFEVMSVILFSALTFGVAGAAVLHNTAAREQKSHRAQITQPQHGSQAQTVTHAAKSGTTQQS